MTIETVVSFPLHCSVEKACLEQIDGSFTNDDENHTELNKDAQSIANATTETQSSTSTLTTTTTRTSRLLVIRCHHDGVCWRGLYPILMQAKRRVSLTLLLRSFRRATVVARRKVSVARNEEEDHQRIRHRSVALRFPFQNRSNMDPNSDVVVLPPTQTRLSLAWNMRLLHWESIHVKVQTLTAWVSTLGGGYFLCRHLDTAVQLARQQRFLATWIGDETMADRCTINEAFNYIHAGQFQVASRLVSRVERSAARRGDQRTVRICEAAKLFSQRVEQSAKYQTTQRDDTLDDYQRIRIVVRDRSGRQPRST